MRASSSAPGASRRDVSGGERDLDVRAGRRRVRVSGSGVSSTERRIEAVRRGDPSLRQPQQRQTRLRLVTPVVGLAVGLLGQA